MRVSVLSAVLLCALPHAAGADPALECGKDASSQVEIGRCVAETEERVDHALGAALSIARESARSLDEVTGRAVAVPALEAAQSAWTTYRDRHCDAVGALFGGGSGTGIGIRSCRVELGRARVAELIALAR